MTGPLAAGDSDECLSGLPAEAMAGLAASDIPVAVFAPDDRLVYASPEFRRLYDIQPGPQTFGSLLRHCHEAGSGVIVDTDDFDQWLSGANAKRRSAKSRAFEIDHVSGRWFWANETNYGGGWILLILTDLTGFKRSEAELRDARDAAVRLAETDTLTGVSSRRAIMRYLEECAANTAYEAPLSVALMDIDHFKSINDDFGHDIGDKVLASFGQECLRVFRNNDRIGRVGGEEFLLVLPKTDQDDALRAIERFRRHHKRFRAVEENRIDFTFSAGVAQFEPGMTVEGLYKRADQALYRAKLAGRDRSIILLPTTARQDKGENAT